MLPLLLVPFMLLGSCGCGGALRLYGRQLSRGPLPTLLTDLNTLRRL